MSKIFDNIEMSFESGLKAILSNLGVKRADFCVGYLNLRGWKLVADNVDALSGADVYEKDVQWHAVKVHRVCRLLIGMHRQPGDLVRDMFSADKKIVDNAQAAAWKQCPIRPSCPIPSTRHRALLAKHHGLIGDEIAIVEGRNETKQEPQGETTRRPAASPRRRKQATTPAAPPAPTDDEVLE